MESTFFCLRPCLEENPGLSLNHGQTTIWNGMYCAFCGAAPGISNHIRDELREKAFKKRENDVSTNRINTID